jgi:hypothetical protein
MIWDSRLWVYSISWECDRFYIGQTEHCIEIRLKEHLRQPAKLTLAEQSFNKEHCIHRKAAKVLSTKARYMGQIKRKTVEPNSIPAT